MMTQLIEYPELTASRKHELSYKILGGEEASLSPCGVKDGSRVALGQNEPVVGGILRVGNVVPGK